MEVPKEHWMSSNESLQRLIEKLHKEMEVKEKLHSGITNLANMDLLLHASGGLALEGIYWTKKEDILEKREQLLAIPHDLYFTRPVQGAVLEQKEFSSSAAESAFHKSMEKLGFSLTCSAKGGFFGFQAEADVTNTTTEETKQKQSSHSEKVYICTTKYNYIPVASCYILKDQMCLSSAALNELKSIEEIVKYSKAAEKDDLIKDRYGNFFKRFGSHANQGPINFGGIFWWKATSEGFKKEHLEEVKKEASSALNAYVGLSYAGIVSVAGSVDVTKTHSEKSVDETTKKRVKKNIQLFVTKTGGPLAVDSINVWKEGLVASNETWSVVDRGLDVVPVWEIILSAHKKDFKDAYQVSTDLINAYEGLTSEKQCLQSGENLASAMDEANSFLSEIESWEVDNVEQKLIKLNNFKQRINEKTRHYKVWNNVCLQNKALQHFLTKVMKYYTDNPEASVYFIQLQMKCLLQNYDDSSDNVAAYSSIIRWLYQAKTEQMSVDITDISMFLKNITKAKYDLQHDEQSLYTSEEENIELKKTTNTNVNLSLNSFLKFLRQNEQNDMILLILSVVNPLGYSIEHSYFQYLLGWKEISFMLNKIESVHLQYLNIRDVQDYRRQAFILLMGLPEGEEIKETSIKPKIEFFHFMVEQMRQSLAQEILDVLAQYSNSIDLQSLKTNLNHLVSGHSEATIKKDTETFAKAIKEVCEISNQVDTVPLETDNQTESAEKPLVTTTNKSFSNLIKRLGLENYFPRKLNKRNFHIVSNSSVNQLEKESELPSCFLQMLMTLNYRFRYLVCNTVGKVDQLVKVSNPLAEYSTPFDTIEAFFSTSSEENRNLKINQEYIHPMDVLLAVYHCSDDFMRQYIYTKLSLCQFAVPLIVPRPYDSGIEMPLWSFRQIQKHMLYRDKTGIVKYREKFVCEVEVPIVCFTRFGSSAYSKSQILNNILSKQKHDIFFHRNCKGSNNNCILMEGLVEMFWFCPGGKEDDQFEKCIGFSNLHGDVRAHKEQAAFLQDIATVNVVIFSDSDKDETGTKMFMDMLKSQTPLICLCPDREALPIGNISTKVMIGLKNLNEATLIDELIKTLKTLLSLSPQSYFSLEKCADAARLHGFVVDEDSKECKDGKSHAQTMMCLLKEKDLPKAKDELLPLSGELWHRWCKKDKELTCLQNKRNRSIAQHESEIESEKKRLRCRQLEMSNNNSFMISLITILKSLPKTTKPYFIQWLKLFIDDLSCDRIIEMREQYNQLWSHFQNENSANHRLEDMEDLSKEMNACMFGLEHLMREVGQTYEALDAMQHKDKSFLELPKIAADMLASGHQLELMDGDACYVPLNWVGAVLDELVKILGDKKLFVLSVLGVQSSGKSTLLNTMFGLQFAVSAGRCTRGAFMQIVELDDNLKKDLSFDYILVIDTEGLRAMELANNSTLNHDNELATFVIGLGNMTLINVFGENPSEVKDILQISVQAFLRMKQVKLTPSCLFVHQNVGDIAALDKNMEARRNLQKELDNMTLLAAEQEHCHVQRFSDVIRFDVKNHIHYFAHLWEGNPPMAPPNPTYSQNVQEVRNIIIQAGGRGSQHSILKISEFKVRIGDLWNALRNENFVFSFKNSQEISVYSKVEKKYRDWTWQLRRDILQTQAVLNNRIKKGEISSVRRMEVENHVKEGFDAIMDELEVFFFDDKDKEILIQWKVNIENKIRNLYIELVEETKKQGEELIKLKQGQNRVQETDYEDELLKRSKKLALELRNKVFEEGDLRDQFNKLWNKWVTEIIATSPRMEKPDIGRDAEDVLFQYFGQTAGAHEKLRNFSRFNSFSLDYSKHISKTYTVKTIFSNLEEQAKMYTEQLKKNLVRIVLAYVDIKQRNKLDYNQGYFHEIINEIVQHVNTASENNKKFKFTDAFKFDLSLFLFNMLTPAFQEMHQAFNIANDPVKALERKQEEFFTCFKISCQGATSVTIFAEVLCAKLLEATRPAVYTRTALAIVDKMSCDYPAFNGNRSKLESYILIYLAEQEDFEKYREYLHFPETFFENFIKGCVDDYCLDTKSTKSTRLKDYLHISLDYFQKMVLELISKSTQVVKDKNGNMSDWLDEFYEGIQDEVVFSRGDLKNLELQEIQDIEFLKEAMCTTWDAAMRKFKGSFDETSFVEFETMPHKILAKHLCGCWEQCPFCRAICTNTVSGHDGDHSVPFHRSQAISGIPWIDSEEFVTEICSSLVMSDSCLVISNTNQIPYKHYRKIGPNYANWSITPDTSGQPYWKWFVCHFRNNLESDYGCKFEGRGQIPDQWEQITKEAVITQLKKEL
ncbi:interferon-induced very large GTPase 1-like [Discoglossus pictus]